MLPSTLDPRRKDRLACKSGYYSHIWQQPWRGVRLREGCLENVDLQKTDPNGKSNVSKNILIRDIVSVADIF